MDIIKFINSRDIREHLRKIDYKFSPLEAMFLIHQARNISLKEKHEAYNELIELYPDYIVDTHGKNMEPQPLSVFLRELIREESELIVECMREGDEAVYYYTRLYKDSKSWHEPGIRYTHLYPSYQECFTKATEDAEIIKKLQITKKYLNGKHDIELTLLPDGTILNVSGKSDGYIGAFNYIYIRIPTPFKRGDILIDTQERISDNSHECIVVLNTIDSWGGKELSENGYIDSKSGKVDEMDFAYWDNAKVRHSESGDVSDMYYTGYFQDNYQMLFWAIEWTYLDLEYYRGDLSGKRGIFKAMSNFLKGNIDGELLMKAYHVLSLREALAHEEGLLDFIDEHLVLAGLEPEKNNDASEKTEGTD